MPQQTEDENIYQCQRSTIHAGLKVGSFPSGLASLGFWYQEVGHQLKEYCSSYMLYLCNWHSELRPWTSTGTGDKFYKPKNYSGWTLHASSSIEQSPISLLNPRDQVARGLPRKAVQPEDLEPDFLTDL